MENLNIIHNAIFVLNRKWKIIMLVTHVIDERVIAYYFGSVEADD